MRKLLTVFGFLAFLLFGLFMWDYNEAQNDQRQLNALAYDDLRGYFESGDPNFGLFTPYIGSQKTKIFHAFGSVCTRNIKYIELIAFKDRQDAEKKGYLPCDECVK